MARCADDRAGRAIRPDRRGLRALVGAGPGTRPWALLDRAGRLAAAGAARLIDIGTGTGQLAFGALARWPEVSVVGVDASAGMRAMAERRRRPARSSRRDAAVPHRGGLRRRPAVRGRLVRPRALVVRLPARAEPRPGPARSPARLRPAASLAYVSWLQRRPGVRAGHGLRRVLEILGIGARASDGRSGDLPSVERAAGELRRAGFAGVSAEAALLEHRFTVEGYVAFLSEFDEETLFEELDPSVRDACWRRCAERLSGLSAGRPDDAVPDRLRQRTPLRAETRADRACRQPISSRPDVDPGLAVAAAAAPSAAASPSAPRLRRPRRRPAPPRRAAAGPWR